MSRQISRRRDFARNERRDQTHYQMDADKTPSKPATRGMGFWVVAVGLVLGCAATVAAITSSSDEDKYFVSSL